ncbi:MAG: DUF4339 domain-containing protein [Methylacidiphilales bacterium]|nr:DUF4339 domain-containing protein [Candidatus Methylacidiphilales bacterium]
MVDEVRYYYSKDGTETQGPVNKTALRQLFLDQIIDSGSFICREDESDWQPLDPGIFQSRPMLRPPLRGPRPTQSSPSSGPSRPKLRSFHRNAWYTDTNLLDPRFLRTLNVICVVLTFGGALLAVHLRYVVFADTLRSADSLYEVLEYFAGSAGVIFILPYLFSLFFRYPTRRPALVIGILCVAPLLLWAEYKFFSSDAARHGLFARENSADASDLNVPWRILPNGYIDFAPALLNLQEIKGAASTDNTDMAVVRRDLVVVIDDLMTRLKACNAAAGNCAPFNPLTIGSLDTIKTRLSLISTLRDTQADLDNFLQALVANCRVAVATDDLSSDSLNETIANFRKSARTDQLSALTNITMKISDDETACLTILEQNWGRWHVDNGAISFDDPNALASYNISLQAVQNDIQAVHDLEKQ